jgi:WD40 repeat protein
MSTHVTVQVSRLIPDWSTPVDDYVSAMALQPAGQTTQPPILAVGTAEGLLHRLDSVTGQPVTTSVPVLPMSITQAAWSGDWLAVCGQHNQVWVTHTNNVTIKRTFGTGWIDAMAWHPTEPWLLIGAGKQAMVWDVAQDTVRYQSSLLPKNVMGLAWHPNLPNQFAVVAGDTLIRLDITKPAPVRQFHWGALLFGLAWSPDGQVLATATHDNALHVWYAKTGNDLHMSGYPGRIKTLAWQPNSRFIATAGDADITIWDFAGKGPAGSMPVVLSAHEAKVDHVTYCGAQLASADANGQVFVWLPPETSQDDAMEAPLWAYPAASGITQLLYPLADVLYIGTQQGMCTRLTPPE